MSSAPTGPYFRCEPDPENPGWHRYEMAEAGNYNRTVLGGLWLRVEDADKCRCRLIPREHHLNSGANIHGGITLGLIDASLFAALHMLRGLAPSLAVTIDLQAQFIGPGNGDRPLDCVTELLRETRRMAFLRGLVVQEDALVASFTATVRKSREPSSAPR